MMFQGFLWLATLVFIGFTLTCNNVEGISVQEDLTLTLQQKNILDKFKVRVAPLLTRNHMKTDLYLIRWLRARNFDMNAAERMLHQNLIWRRENRMDTILEEDWSDMMKDLPAAVDTYDKEGRPIGNLDLFEWDIRRIILQGQAPRGLRYVYHLLENVTMQVFEQQAKGKNVTQFTVLGSADGFNVVQHGCGVCIPYWIQFIQSLENNYNGWMHELIALDAPSTISVIMEAIKPFLSEQTRKTFRIFGPNRARWMPYLDERIARDQRRVQYGGTKPS